MRSEIRLVICVGVLGLCPIAAQCLKWPQGTARPSTQAVLTIKLENPEIRTGESAVLHIELTNAAKRTLELIETFVQRDYEVRLVDARGGQVPLTRYGADIRKQPIVDFRKFSITLAPGQTLKADEDIAQIYSITTPGRYEASVCRVVVGLGPVLSNSVSLQVR